MCRGENSKSTKKNNGAFKHSWIIEDPTINNGKGVLTIDGVENIAQHKYKPGHYTYLDNILDPFWMYVTNLLPMSMAPNLVTAMGGLHCALSYVVLWYHSPNLDKPIPVWTIRFAGLCTLLYYTFDCMDGKQARRTGNSTPLGQLFDHGFDCLCLLAHVSCTAGYLMIGGSHWYLAFQTSLQLIFFMAQWEEYYTDILPHAMGNWFGVTEINYGTGLFAIFNSFIDRERFWLSTVQDVLLPGCKIRRHTIASAIANVQMRHFGLSLWFLALLVTFVGFIIRVLTHENVVKNRMQLSAVSKLFTPFLISIGPFVLPTHVLCNETRYVSIATGLLFSLLTKKMIVFSMAKMTYATFQMEILPLAFIFMWIRYDDNITDRGATVLLCGLSAWYSYRMLKWVSKAIDQICKRLDILCFRIK